MEYEKLFSNAWLRKHPVNIFMLGFIFSELGIITAIILFRDDVSLMSLAFTSLLLLQPLSKMLTREANLEFRENKYNLRLIFKDHKELFEIYFFLFLGILLSYGIFAVMLPDVHIVQMFGSQIGIPCTGLASQPQFCDQLNPIIGQSYGTLGQSYEIVGQAAAQRLNFWGIVGNNFLVSLVALVFSLAYGAGSILFLTWNASVWGTVFGYYAKVISQVPSQLNFITQQLPFLAPILSFFALMAKVLPHTVTEASAYFMAVIAGGVLSKALLMPKISDKQLSHVLFDTSVFFVISILLVFLAGFLEVYVFPLL